MRIKLLGVLGVAVLASMAASCGTTEKGPDAKVTPFTDPKNPDETPVSQVAYPDGPYGLSKGSVVPNFKFLGWHNPQIAADVNNLEEIDFAQFYNPTGTDTWPADGSYRPGEPKPKVLWIDVSAQWCGPCNQESKTDLPPLYAKYQPMGAEIVLELIEDNNGGPALPTNLHMWTTAYKTAWPAIIDPSRQMFTLASADAYPANILIDTRTMKVIAKVAGVPPAGDAFFTTLEGALAQ